MPEGEAKIRTCEECTERAMESTALKGRQMIQQELDVLRLDWEDYSIKLSSLQDGLDKAVNHWGQYDDQYGIISQWIKEMERRIKDFPLKSTLEDKQELLKKYQVSLLYLFYVKKHSFVINNSCFHGNIRPDFYCTMYVKCPLHV